MYLNGHNDSTCHLTQLASDPNEGTMGGDPHSSIMLPDNNMLCYTVQGKRGSVFNLISNKNFHMNALFVLERGMQPGLVH